MAFILCKVLLHVGLDHHTAFFTEQSRTYGLPAFPSCRGNVTTQGVPEDSKPPFVNTVSNSTDTGTATGPLYVTKSLIDTSATGYMSYSLDYAQVSFSNTDFYDPRVVFVRIGAYELPWPMNVILFLMAFVDSPVLSYSS